MVLNADFSLCQQEIFMAKKALKSFSQDSLSTFAAWTSGFGLGWGESWCG